MTPSLSPKFTLEFFRFKATNPANPTAPQHIGNAANAPYVRLLDEIEQFVNENGARAEPPLLPEASAQIQHSLAFLRLRANTLATEQCRKDLREIVTLLNDEKIPLRDRIDHLLALPVNNSVDSAATLSSILLRLQLCSYEHVLKNIVNFVNNNAARLRTPPDAASLNRVVENFGILKRHLLTDNLNFFSSHRELLCGTIRTYFSLVDDLLRNENIPLQDRINVVLEMSDDGIHRCSGGVGSAAQKAVEKLQILGSGFKGRVFVTMLEDIKQIILEFLLPKVGGNMPNIHFLHAHFNRLAAELGFEQIQDPFARGGNIEEFEYLQCKSRVLEKLDPVKVAQWLAQSYLSEIRNHGVGDDVNLIGRDNVAAFYDRHATCTAVLKQQFDEVPGHLYLTERYDAEGSIDQIQIAQNSMPIAKRFLEKFELLGVATIPAPIVIAQIGDQGRIVTRGCQFFWREKNGSCTELELRDLVNVSPDAIVAQLGTLAMTDSERIQLIDGIAQYVLDEIKNSGTHINDVIATIPDHWFAGMARLHNTAGCNSSCTDFAVEYFFKSDQIDRLRLLCEAGARFEIMDSNGENRLLIAARLGGVALVDYLINPPFSASPDGQDSLGYTVFMHAALAGSLEVMDKLIEAGANINKFDKRGNTALLLVLQDRKLSTAKKIEVLLWLLRHGADPAIRNKVGWTPEILAVETKSLAIVQALRASCSDANVSVDYPSGHREPTTPLQVAVSQRAHEIVRYLIDCGANLNAPSTGPNLILMAARTNNLDTVKVLVEAGIDIHATNKSGENALTFAIKENNVELVSFLLSKGIEIRDMPDLPVICMAIKSANPELVSVLLEAGAKTNLKYLDPALKEQLSHREFSKRFGITLPPKDALLESSLSYAKRLGNLEIVELLKNAEASEMPSVDDEESDQNLPSPKKSRTE